MDARLSFGCGIVLGVCAVLYIDHHRKKTTQIKGPSLAPLSEDILSPDTPQEIRLELYSRSISFFGEKRFAQLQNKLMVVVGLGGVGSHAAHMLARVGATHLRLIDFDLVSLSSLNRNALATLHDVGIPKVEAIRYRILQILPWIQIESVNEMFRESNAEELLQGNPAYVLDCIDDISTKAALIAYCSKNNIKVLTSMGAGGKADPTRIRIGTLKDCVRDPLASKIKWKLQKFHSISPEDVTAVYSSEKPVVDLLPLTEEQKENPQEFGAVDYLRLRVMPVLGTSPAIFGQAMASYVVCGLTECQYLPETCDPMSKNLKHKMMMALRKNEMKRFQDSSSLDLDDDELEFVVHQVY